MTEHAAPKATPTVVADRLTSFVVDHIEQFVARHAPAFELPRVFAGYPVGSDVRADLAFTLGFLDELGVSSIAGVDTREAVTTVLAGVDGAQTHTFFSYRVAETIGRYGRFEENALLAEVPDATRRNLEEACDSTSWIELLDQGLPANYAAVLARCELGRRALGLTVDQPTLDQLITRTRDLITRNPKGFIDDSEDGNGARYDIYSADVYLFTEPFADELGPAWARGLGNVLDLVATVSGREGSAMTWGRSLGALAVSHTIELAALALQRGLADDTELWLARAGNAVDHLGDWTDGTLVTAYHRRAQDRYRGPERWLQLTFDCLGKLAWSATRLRTVTPSDSNTTGAPHLERPRDRLVILDDERHAGVWAYRSTGAAFVVPFVGTAANGYLPAPRHPGLYEVPVDHRTPPVGVPLIDAAGERYVGGGVPTALDHHPGAATVTYEGFPAVHDATRAAGRGAPLPGTRRARLEVQGHVLRVHESLQFDEPPDAISVLVAETTGRPLRVEVSASTSHRIDTIETAGMAAFRSFWSELPRVHQVEVEPDASVDLEWSVRPLLRVATPDPTHHYHRSLYDPLAHDVVERGFGSHLVMRPHAARDRLRGTDVFHLHWPEWFVEQPEHADAFIRLLEETSTTLVWTQHNLRPHRELTDAHELYQRFARAADIVIHHSDWGREMACERFDYRPDAVQVVLPHGHFGALLDGPRVDRAVVERELGLTPCALRIGIVGAPRRDKQTDVFMRAFASCRRDDIQLLVLSLDDEPVPDDPRITALPYEFVDREVYNRRLAVVDVVALPFDPDGEMLTTGVVGDVIGAGLPAITSTWGYATEALSAAGLVYRTHDELVELLESLSSAQLDEARRASAALQPQFDWQTIARRFFDIVVAAGGFDI